MSKSIRIRTTPGESRNIQIKVEQDFDFLEIMSLKISQQDLYTSFCANYGVVVGRIIANAGFGVPNSKVSVFVPISNEDEKNTLIKDLYPFKTVTSKNKGVRYNLLLSKATCELNTAVGTFPTKEEVLNNEIMIEIFDKYYKYTTKTNEAGDYMIFGVPTGQQTIHMDVDLSDAGPFSVRPYDFIDSGYNEKLFKSRVEFKKSENLNTLPQIKTGDKGVNVIPFWGDEEQCEIGITRVDFDTNFNFQPSSILIGSIYTDNSKNSLNKRCNPTNSMGEHSELRTGPGLLETIRVKEYTYENIATTKPTKGTKIIPLSLEKFTVPQGPTSIDENGAFVVTVPMNLDHVITDEFGNSVPSLDPEKGVATKGMYRFKIKFLEPPAAPKRRTAQLIFPSLNRHVGGTPLNSVGTPPNTPGFHNSTENVRWSDDINVWKNSLGDELQPTDSFYKDFHEFEFNQIYSISQYMTKYKKGGNRWSFLGIKDVDGGEHNLFPFTTAMLGFNIMYSIIKPFINLMAALIKLLIILINMTFRLCFRIKLSLPLGIGTVINFSALIPLRPFNFLKSLPLWPLTLQCESDTSSPFIIDPECNNTLPDCFNNCGNICLNFQIWVPHAGVNNTGSGSGVFNFYCGEYDKVDSWLCCALYDLAIDRKILRYVFNDAWLTGSAYMPQFKYKSRTKGSGVQKDKFCGPGGDTLGSNNYKNQKCCTRGGGNIGDCDKCIVRGPDMTDLNQGSSLYHQNNYNSGAWDIDDVIYCPESFPVKIVNLGRADACPEVIDRIDRCIVTQECTLELFENTTCSSPATTNTDVKNCLTGTYYENGYDTTQWVNDIGLTTYENPAMVVLKMMQPCSKGVEGLFTQPCGVFSSSCNECEADNYVFWTLRLISRIYTDVIIGPKTTPVPNSDLDEFTGFDYDEQQTPRFNPTDTQGGYGITPTEPIPVTWGETFPGNSNPGNSLADVPYFYFGLVNGSTAIDKLRKDYLVEK